MANYQSTKLSSLSCVLLVFTCLLAACGKPEPSATLPLVTLDQTRSELAIKQLQELSIEQNRKAIIFTERLKIAIEEFLATPNPQTQSALKASWQPAHESYLGSQLGLFVDSPAKSRLTFDIGAWPIQPGFLDSIDGYPDSGIINDVTIDVTAETLRLQHGITDREEVCLGYHAIEYLVFERPLVDYVIADDRAADDPVRRRRELLRLISIELNQDLAEISNTLPVQFSSEAGTLNSNQLLLDFLSSTRRYLQLAFRESNYLAYSSLADNSIQSAESHAPFSRTSAGALITELESLNQFTLIRVDLNPIFTALDATTAENYRSTLSSAIELMTDTQADEASRGNLPLMLSALLNQLEVFELMLQQYLQTEISSDRS